MTDLIRVLSAGLQLHSVFVVSNLAAIALINFLKDKTNAKKLKKPGFFGILRI